MTPASPAADRPLSLQRITSALSALLGRGKGATAPATIDAGPSPLAIVEALLFVGTPQDEPLSAERIAGTMRDVSADEVATLIDQLNARYATDGTAYRIFASAGGYRMTLCEQHERIRDKLLGRSRSTTLSPAAIEVLSVIAYRQPIAGSEIDRLREARSHTLVAQLVRHGLVRSSKTTDVPARTVYATTPQFLTLLGIDSVEHLPRAEEFDLPDLPG